MSGETAGSAWSKISVLSTAGLAGIFFSSIVHELLGGLVLSTAGSAGIFFASIVHELLGGLVVLG